jgi:23S rRNA pseudoU1915 N3-methylase RlmH
VSEGTQSQQIRKDVKREVVKMGVRTKKYGSHPFAKKIKKEEQNGIHESKKESSRKESPQD